MLKVGFIGLGMGRLHMKGAAAHPEKYQNLQIRVCGRNVLWNDICKEEQDGFIRQAEALI
jgi:autonomous glycyl radical cofactor GrcA